MKPFRFLSAVVFLFVSFELFAALSYPAEKEKWLGLTTGEFRIYSNASERVTRQVVTALLRMREAVGKITQLKVRSPLPVNVYIFRDARSFAPYRDAIIQRRNASIGGVFLSSENAKFIVMQADLEEQVDRLIYHELTHYFVENTLTGLPLWFNEGIAEYYSTFSSRGDEVSIGAHVPEHVMWLREQQLIPLSKLFAIDVRSPEYSEGRRQGVFYAESWALVHYFLLGNDQRREQLGKFLSLLGAGKPTEEAFRTAFQTSYGDLESELRMYVRKPTMAYRRYSLAELEIPTVPPTQPISRAEVLYALGHLLARANASTAGDAEAFLTESLRVDPDLAEAYAALGLIHQVRGKQGEANAAFEKAVSLGSSDVNVFISYGGAMLDRLQQTMRGPGGAAASDTARARQLFERAVLLDPSSARAYAGLGASYIMSAGDPAPGIAALEKSLSLGASQEDVAFNLVQLYSRAGRRDDAQRVIDGVLSKSKDPELARQAREAVLQVDVIRADDLYRAGNREEALAIMRSVAGSTTNERLKAQVQSFLADAERDAVVNKHIAVVNSAIDKATAGKLGDAVKILDELLPKITDPAMKDRVQKLRDDMAAARRQ